MKSLRFLGAVVLSSCAMLTAAESAEKAILQNRAPLKRHSSAPKRHLEKEPAEEIILVPYGWTKLRMTEFPLVK